MQIFILLVVMLQVVSFKETQRQYSRVKTAYEENESTVENYFKYKKLNPSELNLFVRAFKHEKELEIWINQNGRDTYDLLTTYSYCANSGTLGPKRKEGDLQIPEGVYHINHFNPESNFHLSLGLNYPNASDNILSDRKHPGGSIYIHGNCVTIGCIPVTDDKIKELYILAVEARNNGQKKIPVHIFPTRFTKDGALLLKNSFAHTGNTDFWNNLKEVYEDFERTKKLRPVRINSKGEYFFDGI
jgi:murein L,D-transpeptidase YafK